MADLYSALGANTRKVLTRSDSTGPETTWLIVHTSNLNWEGGESQNVNPELTTSNSINYKAIVECIQSYCEVYEVVRADFGDLAIKVRHNSVPYVGNEGPNNGSENTTLTSVLQAHANLGNAYNVWNGRFQGDQIFWD
jgi:hypothetical protein